MKALAYICLLAIIFTTAHSEEKCENKNHRLFDQEFGMALTPDDLITSMMSPWMFRDYFRPWRFLDALARDVGSTIVSEKDKFHINLDVQHFSPDEINVKTADGYVVVEAKHEEKKDEHGSISRQFVRKYSLPEGVESEDIVSQLSSDGILTITAPRREIDSKGERVIPITQTGPVRKEAKEAKAPEGSCQAKDEKCGA
ncbi:unnamed protein product [Leptosia nina]|uniref:SHSP domain-containing protein n=1 Tax=Leptosia nina TaxID=320188 RepID=A0AAV1JDY0_9NEOP